jgi:hypothetical protein
LRAERETYVGVLSPCDEAAQNVNVVSEARARLRLRARSGAAEVRTQDGSLDHAREIVHDAVEPVHG